MATTSYKAVIDTETVTPHGNPITLRATIRLAAETFEKALLDVREITERMGTDAEGVKHMNRVTLRSVELDQ